MKLLLTAIGKRVQLIKHLKERFYVIGVDAGDLAPAISFVDKFYRVPKCNEKDYLDELLKICDKENIDCLIPLYENEFLILSKNRNKFENVGTKLILSNTKIIDICNDKEKTYKFLKENNIRSPKLYSYEEVESIIKKNNEMLFPLIVKPKNGMGSKDVFKIKNIKELRFFKSYVENCIIQQFIEGEEFTVDVLCDFCGNYIYMVPRKRLEVRSGEVVKSCTIMDESIIKETIKIIEKFNNFKNSNKASLMGPLTIQFFRDLKGINYLLEINPRFGGGVPLSFEAGANYAKALEDMMKGKILGYKKEFREITMLRYDEAVFVE